MTFHAVYFPMFLYSITASMFLPVMQSYLYARVCLSLTPNSTVSQCSNRSSASNPEIHKQTNYIMLISSVVLCLSAIVSSSFIGRLGDRYSRKVSLLVPFVGLLLADFTIWTQMFITNSSPFFFIISELVFGIFGGYMTIFSTAFSFLTAIPMTVEERSKSIARMEGLIGLGGMIGFLLSSQLPKTTYLSMASFFILVHLICIIFIITMNDVSKSSTANKTRVEKLEALRSLITSDKKMSFYTNSNVIVIFIAFGFSFFVFIGSAHILFFFLKHHFGWDAEQYGYLRVLFQGSSTFMALLIYPYLKTKGVQDSSLAIWGLITRALGKLVYVLISAPYQVYFNVIFEMFSRFPATALRALLASNLEEEERGLGYALIGALEAVCNCLAAIFFHLVFPWSMSFMPQLSFLVMCLVLLPVALLVGIWRPKLNVSEHRHKITTTVEVVEDKEEEGK